MILLGGGKLSIFLCLAVMVIFMVVNSTLLFKVIKESEKVDKNIREVHDLFIKKRKIR